MDRVVVIDVLAYCTKCLLGLCVIGVELPSFVFGKFSVTVYGGELAYVLVPRWLLGLSSDTVYSTGKKGHAKPSGTSRRCVFPCAI